IIAELLHSIGISFANAEECEAEDVIATLTTKIDGPIEIVSGDRDLYSLVRDPRIKVLYTLRGVSELASVDQRWVHEKYGIPGDRYMDYAILRGDPSDGLPGVRGIGEKTAAQLLTRYGSLDAILAATDLSPTIRAKLNASRDYLVAARRVVGAVMDCGIVMGDGALPRAPREPMELAALAQRYGVEASVKRLLEALA
ncbi:MAG TPA: 5'-3' exonuclease H3TH domain-containing protein, partial [Candidatus Limnocylindria bacterium]|nr:5'-3' exonuclease H3TH domain-containing protein [Candidatus Limnocylindria bacterium]